MLQIQPHIREDATALREVLRSAARAGDCKLLGEAVYWLAHLFERPTKDDVRVLHNSNCLHGADVSHAFMACFSFMVRLLVHDGHNVSVAERVLARELLSWTNAMGLNPIVSREKDFRYCNSNVPRRADKSFYGFSIQWDGFRWFTWDPYVREHVYLGDSPDPRFHRHQQELAEGGYAEAGVYWNGFDWIAITHKKGTQVVSHKGIWNPRTQEFEPVDLPPPPDGYYFTDRGRWNPETKEFESVVMTAGDVSVLDTRKNGNGLPERPAKKTNWFLLGAFAALAASTIVFVVSRRSK
jgi:hypothetical protein